MPQNDSPTLADWNARSGALGLRRRVPTRSVRKYTVTPRGRIPRVPMKL